MNAPFPRGMPIRRAGARPTIPQVPSMYGEVGSALRTTADDVGEYSAQKQLMEDMVRKRQMALRVQAAKEEADRMDLEFKQAEADREQKQWDLERIEAQEKRKSEAEQLKLDRESRAEQSRLDRESRERQTQMEIAAGKYKKFPPSSSYKTPRNYEDIQRLLDENRKKQAEISKKVGELREERQGWFDFTTDDPTLAEQSLDDHLLQLQEDEQMLRKAQGSILSKGGRLGPNALFPGSTEQGAVTPTNTLPPTPEKKYSIDLAIKRARDMISDPNTSEENKAKSRAFLQRRGLIQ